MFRRLTAVPALALLAAPFLLAQGPAHAHAKPDDACAPPGAWVDAASGDRVPRGAVLARAAGAGVVLLGETHDSAEHHRWQLQTVAALHGRAGAVVLGFEMFPRRVQPVLDRWVAGELDEAAFLAEVGWDRVWGIDAALYMPLFHFARINRVPMVALNVDKALIERIGEVGWVGVAEEAREGVSDPAPPTAAYVEWLVEVYREHRERRGDAAGAAGEAGEPGPDDPEFRRFADAQLAWDRAMAEALAAAAAGGAAVPGHPLVIGIVGGGHLENRFGVPHQLAALGAGRAAVLLPWDRGRDCADLTAGLADAVFGLDAPAAAVRPAPPRLGVVIRAAEAGLRVIEVAADSIAEATGIRADDVIVDAAEMAVAAPADLIAVVHRQAPGTWLPLTIERGGAMVELVARFPAAPDPSPSP